MVSNIRDNSGSRVLEDLLICLPSTAFPQLMPLLVFLEIHEHMLDKILGLRGHWHAPRIELPVTGWFFRILFSGNLVFLVQSALLGHKLATPLERGLLVEDKKYSGSREVKIFIEYVCNTGGLRLLWTCIISPPPMEASFC